MRYLVPSMAPGVSEWYFNDERDDAVAEMASLMRVFDEYALPLLESMNTPESLVDHLCQEEPLTARNRYFAALIEWTIGRIAEAKLHLRALEDEGSASEKYLVRQYAELAGRVLARLV